MKNVTRVLCGLLLLLLFFASNGQSYDTKDLRDYKTPDLVRTTLVVPFGGQYRNSRNTNLFNNTDLRFSSSVGLSHFKISRKTINNFFFNTNYSYQKEKDKLSQPYESKLSNLNLNGLLSNQRFLRPKVFIQPLINFFASNRSSDIKESITQNYDNTRTISSTVNGRVYIGYGRLENISTLWNASCIIDILESYNLLETTLDAKQMILFADHIARLQTIRNLDFRLEGIEETKQLYDWMFENGIIKESPVAIAVLMDAYRFERFYSRFSGFEIKVAPITDWSFNEYRASDLNFVNNNITVGGELLVNYSIPLSMQYQLELFTGFSYSKQQSLRSDNENSSKAWVSNSGINFNFFASRRTFLLSYLRARYSENLQEYPNSTSETNLFSFSSGLQFFYYISPMVRFEAEVFYNYNENGSPEIYQLNSQTSLRIGFSYIVL